jgi:hypothetical protein
MYLITQSKIKTVTCLYIIVLTFIFKLSH